MSNTEELKAKIFRLQQLLAEIEKGDEHNFDSLFLKIHEEYDIERNSLSEINHGGYANQLLQTIQKQAKAYITEKEKRSKNAPDYFKFFVINFKQDVIDELSACKNKLTISTHVNKSNY